MAKSDTSEMHSFTPFSADGCSNDDTSILASAHKKMLHDLSNRNALLMSHEAQDAEYGESRVKTRAAIDDWNEKAIFDEIVVKSVVWAQGNHTTDSYGVGVEYLRPCIDPHLRQKSRLWH